MTSVRILRRVLTPENHLAVPTEARQRSKKDVELIEARLNPKADVPSSVRKIAAPACVPMTLALTTNEATSTVASSPAAATPPATSAPACPRPDLSPSLEPLSPERYRLQFTISRDAQEKLRRVQNLLCREVPDGDPAVIFERALDLLVRDIEKKKLGGVPRPRAARPTTAGSRI